MLTPAEISSATLVPPFSKTRHSYQLREDFHPPFGYLPPSHVDMFRIPSGPIRYYPSESQTVNNYLTPVIRFATISAGCFTNLNGIKLLSTSDVRFSSVVDSHLESVPQRPFSERFFICVLVVEPPRIRSAFGILRNGFMLVANVATVHLTVVMIKY